MKKSLVVLLLCCLAMALKAQRTEIGVTGGGSFYMGDLNPKKPFELTQPAYGIVYRYNFNNRVALKGNLIKANVRGDDLITGYREERGINFASDIYELAVMMEFNFFEYFTGASFNFVSPYLFGGVGVFTYNPKATYADVTYNLRELETEGVNYSLLGTDLPAIAVCMPFGVGLKYSIGRVVGLTFEWGMRKTTTDYLDDVSTAYITQNGAPFDPTGNYSPGMQRGNSKDNDWYSFAGASIVFRINLRGTADCDEPDKIRF